MPRFIANPVVVIAVQYKGDTSQWSDDFRRSIRRHLPGGLTEINTGDGPRALHLTDWLVHGPSGAFTIWSAADFERMFSEAPTEPVAVPSKKR